MPTHKWHLEVSSEARDQIKALPTSRQRMAVFAAIRELLILQPELHERREPVKDVGLVAVAGADSRHALGATPVPPAETKRLTERWAGPVNIE